MSAPYSHIKGVSGSLKVKEQEGFIGSIGALYYKASDRE